MADGNFITNRRTLGKKNGSKHDDRNDRIVSPLGRPPDLGSLFSSLHYLLIRLNPLKVYPKYLPIEVELFWQLAVRVLAYMIVQSKLMHACYSRLILYWYYTIKYNITGIIYITGLES
jgi:hypothetical protein